MQEQAFCVKFVVLYCEVTLYYCILECAHTGIHQTNIVIPAVDGNSK